MLTLLAALFFRQREDLAMSRPLIITSQPRRCISRAISFPMPPEEPVTCSFDDALSLRLAHCAQTRHSPALWTNEHTVGPHHLQTKNKLCRLLRRPGRCICRSKTNKRRHLCTDRSTALCAGCSAAVCAVSALFHRCRRALRHVQKARCTGLALGLRVPKPERM